MNNILCILGMHRSGTSFTANWISQCGLNLGDRMMPGALGNEDGHFEDLDFHDLHEEILKSRGIGYGGFIESPVEMSVSNTYIERIQALLNNKSSLRQQWGWKEPRTCLFIDEYLKINEYLKTKHKMRYFIIYRNFNEVVDSLIRRDFNYFKKYNNSKLNKINRLRFKLKEKYFIEKIYKKNHILYLKSWIIYNKKILSLVNHVDKHQLILIDSDLINKYDCEILKKMEEWEFNFQHKVSFSSVYNPHKIKRTFSKNIEKLNKTNFIEVTEAEHVLNQLHSYSTFK